MGNAHFGTVETGTVGQLDGLGPRSVLCARSAEQRRTAEQQCCGHRELHLYSFRRRQRGRVAYSLMQ